MSLPKLTTLVVTALLVLCGAVYALALAFGQEREERVVVRVGEVTRVVLRTDVGDVRVRSGQNGGPIVLRRRARWLFGAPSMERSRRGGRLLLEASCDDAVGPCATDVDLVVPDGVDVVASSRAGDVVAERLGGRVALASGAGDVVLAGGRPVTASATTSAGDVTLTFRNAPVSITGRTAAGDVAITLPEDQEYRLDATFDGGELAVDGVFRNDLASRRIVAETEGGDVTVTGRATRRPAADGARVLGPG